MHKLTKKPSTTYYLPSTTYYLPSSKYSKARQTLNEKSESKGFTIVELLVVIVVIGILAAITIVSYTGISQKAVTSALQSDLSNAKKQLALYQIDHSAYPTPPLTITGNNYCPSDDTKYCFKASSSNSFPVYSSNNLSNPQSFLLIAGNGTTNYQITNTTPPTLLAQLQPGVTPGAVLELRASKANSGLTQGINSPLTTTWTDTSGNNNNGTLTNFGATTASGWAGAGTTGDPYRAVFDGADDYGQIPDISAGESESFSYEIWGWVDPTLVSNSYALSESLSLSASPLIAIGVGSSRLPRFVYINDAASQNSLQATTGVMDNGQPHHLVGTLSGGTLNLFYDGALVSGVSQAAYPRPTTLNRGYVGAYKRGGSGVASYWRGTLSLARIYPFALSATQVQANYNAGAN